MQPDKPRRPLEGRAIDFCSDAQTDAYPPVGFLDDSGVSVLGSPEIATDSDPPPDSITIDPLIADESPAITSDLLPQPDPRGELYTAIVDKHKIPKTPESVPRDKRIPVEVLDDRTIKIGGACLTLEGHKLFAWNTLLLHPEPTTGEELRSVGFDPTAPTAAFSRAVKSLARMLESATGDGLIGILKQGKDSFYALNPYIVVADSRQLQQEVIGKGTTGSSTSQDSHKKPVEEVEFSDIEGEARDAALTDIVKKYKDHPRVWQALAARQIKSTPIRTHVDNTKTLLDYGKQFPLLDALEEQALFKVIEIGLLAYNNTNMLESISSEDERALINLVISQRILHASNLGLVAQLASRFDIGMFPKDDLVKYGILGLDKAIARFDFSKGYKFSTYATWWIRHAITAATADEGRTIRIPRNVHTQWRQAKRAISDLSAELEREPTIAELALRLKIKPAKVEEILHVGEPHLPSLDKTVDQEEGNDVTLGELLPDRSADMDRLTDQISAQLEIARLFESPELSDTQKLVLALHHGLYNYIDPSWNIEDAAGNPAQYKDIVDQVLTTDGITLKAIAGALGYSKQWVGDRKKEALKLAKQLLETDREISTDQG